jgi:hypothetical protein
LSDEKVILPIEIDTKGAISSLSQLDAAGGRAMSHFSATSQQAKFAVIDLSHVVRDLPFAINNPAILTGPFDRMFQAIVQLKSETGSFKGALASLGSQFTGGTGLLIGISLVSTALALFGDKLGGTKEHLEKTADASKQLKDAVDGIFQATAKEATEVASLVALLHSETETRERKLAAIKELNRIAPETFSNLKLEGDAVKNLDADYTKYIESLKTVIAVKIKQAQLEQLVEKLLKAQGVTLTAEEQRWKSLGDTIVTTLASRVPKDAFNPYTASLKAAKDKSAKEIDGIQDDIKKLLGDITQLSAGIKLKIPVTPEITKEPNHAKIKTGIKKLFETPNFFDLNISVPGISLPKIDPFTENFKKAFTDAKTFEGMLKVEEEFKKINAETKVAAETINETLTPAFQNMFAAIVHGESPVKAFFSSIAQAIEQLISKLIAAAAEALILNLILPGGGGGFGKLFTKLVGVGGIANVGFAGAGGGSIAAPQEILVRQRGSEMVGTLTLGQQIHRRVNGA